MFKWIIAACVALALIAVVVQNAVNNTVVTANASGQHLAGSMTQASPLPEETVINKHVSPPARLTRTEERLTGRVPPLKEAPLRDQILPQ